MFIRKMRVCTSHNEHTNPIFLLNYVFLLQSALRIVLQPRYAAWLRQVIIKACLNYRVCTAIYSQEHLSYFSSDHLHFFQQMTSQHLTFSWSAVLWLIERSEDDRNFVVHSYAGNTEGTFNGLSLHLLHIVIWCSKVCMKKCISFSSSKHKGNRFSSLEEFCALI